MSIEREKSADRTITDCVAKRADATRGAPWLSANEGGELSRPSGNREGPPGWDEGMEFRLANMKYVVPGRRSASPQSNTPLAHPQIACYVRLRRRSGPGQAEPST